MAISAKDGAVQLRPLVFDMGHLLRIPVDLNSCAGGGWRAR